ncbi:universal stress protein [Acidocella aminolytica]|uniref:Universal stress protein UspA n=1 Tax=Acidocella aminolytica 101 = DSM 11237 TaxID=1120923 RepID=A0A0D6PGL3_9PROT|nr:universal stress protein [Acidocella aminolytica]GAN79979.1 universal stress protein UspA [Acidocella aminolytica 101 = DSM 11237]GBQ41294.1 universal stress protein UspA [Acidocella aminolytica 101 = DSM 11237]SHE57799.1 Nucleotide-binding universal stress protein, UspA family [Acidocella aminolytica 101 = DSM 11237]
MQNILACIDASRYAAPVCDLAAWVARKWELPVELLHVVQRKDAVAERHDLSGAIGLGVKSRLLEELTQLDEAEARLQVERGRVLLAAGEERLRKAGTAEVKILHRHGGIVETILEREAQARVVVIGKRGASHEFAKDHIGSKIERVVRASNRPILIAPLEATAPRAAVLAYDGSSAARHALERCANSPLIKDLPVHLVIAGAADENHARLADEVREQLHGRALTITHKPGVAAEIIAAAVAQTPDAVLVMGAYGHSPLRTLIVGSTTTAVIRLVNAPVLLVR